LLKKTTDIIRDGSRIQIIHIIPIAQTRENLKAIPKNNYSMLKVILNEIDDGFSIQVFPEFLNQTRIK
jgi:hypothetical protein